MYSEIKIAIFNPINLIFIILMLLLFIIEIIKNKDFKSIIISIGVLGTFVGVFIGLLDFNTADLRTSITHILEGLKTAFLTSVVGMGLAIILAIIERIKHSYQDNDKEFIVLLDINEKLESILQNNNSDLYNLLIEEVKSFKLIFYEIKDDIKMLNLNNQKYYNDLTNLLLNGFNDLNNSLKLAINHLSKGATQEIIDALKRVIEEFNQELQNQFGENFKELNKAVINLLRWQENYQIAIENTEKILNATLNTIVNTKDTFVEIATYQKTLNNIYERLENIINTYKFQIEELNRHLEIYKNLSEKSEKYLSHLDSVNDKFYELTNTILVNIDKQKTELSNFIEKSILQTQNYIKTSQDTYVDSLNSVNYKFNELTNSIKNDTSKQQQYITNFIEESSNQMLNSIKKNQNELNLIITHFKQIEQEIPEALKVSLESLNNGLASLTRKFKEDYERILNQYRSNIESI